MSIIVSIIVPCFNQAEYLGEALQSVMEQTYTHWECIIVNDGSTDKTESIAKKWLENDARLKYVYQENKGLSSARNFGIAQSQGKFILPLDADDKIASNYITMALEAFQEDTNLKVVYCKAEKFGEEQGLWELPPFSLLDLARFNMIFCSGMFRKLDWKMIGGYDVNMKFGWEDWEFWISLLKNGGKVKCLEYTGFYYRVRKNSMVRHINLEEKKNSETYVTKKHIDFFISNYDILNKNRKQIELSFESKKFAFNLFTKTFFKFKLF